MARPRYLTKSRFKLALECETKLHYTGKPEYADAKKADPFLMALAEGGFQVGELAKLYYPGGFDIKTLDYEESVSETNKLITLDDVTIFEAAVRHENLFIRADVLVKHGDTIDLIEVKAKSYSDAPGDSFLTSSGFMRSTWKEYLYDVAFQKHVMQLAFPSLEIRAHLLLADKDAIASVDGLNQNFLLLKDNKGRSYVQVKQNLSPDELGNSLLRTVLVDEIVDMIYSGTDQKQRRTEAFPLWIERIAERYEHDARIPTDVGKKCARCEFMCSESDITNGLKSGFEECWLKETELDKAELKLPLVTDLRSSARIGQHIDEGKYLLADLTKKDIRYKESDGPGLSQTQRQWLQILAAKSPDSAEYFDAVAMKEEMSGWQYPLHFIDFETSMSAIPFSAGMSPYEGIAFQFSHHAVDDDGAISHADQYIFVEQGMFPNFAFIRRLKLALEKDSGTIFRYASHENTYLCKIYDQLEKSDEPDRTELMAWISTISAPVQTGAPKWVAGPRNMVDMWDLVKKYYYHPRMHGSSSIKKVLPAILSASEYLKEKYMEPIYGTDSIPSLNFEHWQWIQLDDNGVPLDPYSLLPSVFKDIDPAEAAGFMLDSEINEGGAAMTAYARMQFSEMSDQERDQIIKALYKYCELDTFAMVLIWEYWHQKVLSV